MSIGQDLFGLCLRDEGEKGEKRENEEVDAGIACVKTHEADFISTKKGSHHPPVYANALGVSPPPHLLVFRRASGLV